MGIREDKFCKELQNTGWNYGENAKGQRQWLILWENEWAGMKILNGLTHDWYRPGMKASGEQTVF